MREDTTRKSRILIVLSSDSENLSLVKIFANLKKQGESVDIWRAKQNEQAIAPFLRILDYSKILDNMDQEKFSQYSVVICGRSCYEALPLSWVLSFPGIILADDTAMYDGKNVYGDVVCVNGMSNLNNISKRMTFPVVFTGCIKADSAKQINYKYFNERLYFKQNYKVHILYVESGHFPFGKEGRLSLAKAFCTAVCEHPDKAFLVKPRFLRHEAAYGRHRNNDHLYGYIEEYFNGKLPDNLVLLEKHESMDDLVAWSDLSIYTYSSAHIECISCGKPFFHLAGVPSVETADFRKNRMHNLESFMDMAGCTIPYYELSKFIEHPVLAAPEYCELLDGGQGTAVDDFCSLTLYLANLVDGNFCPTPSFCYLSGDLINTVQNPRKLRIQRLKGYITYKTCLFENRFDNYSLLDLWLDEIEEPELLAMNNEQLCEWVDDWLDKKVMDIIDQHQSTSNVFDRAFILRYYHETRRKKERDKMLDSYGEKDSAWYYYSAMRKLDVGAKQEAESFLKKYLYVVDQRGYALTDAESNVHLEFAKSIVNNVGSEGMCDE